METKAKPSIDHRSSLGGEGKVHRLHWIDTVFRHSRMTESWKFLTVDPPSLTGQRSMIRSLPQDSRHSRWKRRWEAINLSFSFRTPSISWILPVLCLFVTWTIHRTLGQNCYHKRTVVRLFVRFGKSFCEMSMIDAVRRVY